MTTRTHSSLTRLNSSLSAFVLSNLKGSTLQVKPISEKELNIEADRFLRVHILIDKQKKKITYSVFSPEWNRPVRVEELGGFDYMEAKIEEELVRLNLDNAAEDILLSVDLLRSWAKANKFHLAETAEQSST